MTLDEAIQTVVAARRQYQAVHQQVHHLREAWATHVDKQFKSPFGLAGAGSPGPPIGRHGALDAVGED